MAKYSRRTTKSIKGTKARSTRTQTFGKGVTTSHSNRVGNKRTTFSITSSGKQRITETLNVGGAIRRTVSTSPLIKRSSGGSGCAVFFLIPIIIGIMSGFTFFV